MIDSSYAITDDQKQLYKRKNLIELIDYFLKYGTNEDKIRAMYLKKFFVLVSQTSHANKFSIETNGIKNYLITYIQLIDPTGREREDELSFKLNKAKDILNVMIDITPTIAVHLKQLFKQKSPLDLVTYFYKYGSNEYKMYAIKLKSLFDHIFKSSFAAKFIPEIDYKKP